MTTPRRFSSMSFGMREREFAGRARQIYDAEIVMATGFRAQFECEPGFQDRVFARMQHDYGDSNRLVARVIRFSRLVVAISAFRDQPLGPDLVITPAAVETYHQLFRALANYADTLIAYGPGAEAREAALTVSYLVNPIVWREAGAPVPAGVRPLHGFTSVRDYLVVVSRGGE